MDNLINNVGVKMLFGVLDLLLVSIVRILYVKILLISENSGGESKNDCMML